MKREQYLSENYVAGQALPIFEVWLVMMRLGLCLTSRMARLLILLSLSRC